MTDILIFAGAMVAWGILVFWVLPKLGLST